MSTFSDDYVRNRAKNEQARTSKDNRASLRDGNMSWSLFSYCEKCDSDDESNVSADSESNAIADSIPNVCADSVSNTIADSAPIVSASCASDAISITIADSALKT